DAVTHPKLLIPQSDVTVEYHRIITTVGAESEQTCLPAPDPRHRPAWDTSARCPALTRRARVFFRPEVPAMAAATIVHDTSEAVELCPPYGLYLKPITKMTISVALPQLKQPGKSISNWEVMERLKGMVRDHQFSALRISKSTMDFIRFEGEVENKSLVRAFLACLDGKTIKLSGFSDILKVRAAEFKIDFPTRHDWDSFFRDAKDMNETLPGERPDTIHLEGLPCKWFALKESGSEKPSEEVLVRVFERFGEIRNVDIPMLDPYREEMTGRNFHTFSFGGHLNFEAYVQYREYAGFIQAMSALRGMKLMYKGEDGKAVACNIKVSFDSTKHLSDASIKKRQLERQKLQELEQQREEQKRREKEAEERQRAEERCTVRLLASGVSSVSGPNRSDLASLLCRPHWQLSEQKLAGDAARCFRNLPAAVYVADALPLRARGFPGCESPGRVSPLPLGLGLGLGTGTVQHAGSELRRRAPRGPRMRLTFLRGGSAAMPSPAAATPVPCGWRALAHAARGLTEPVSRSRRKQKELEEQERERRREEKLRRRAQRQRERELRRGQRKLERLQAEEQRKLQEKIRLEERKLLLAQRNLQSIRLIAELLSRAKVPPAAPAGRGAPAR
ncbi:hypothetical protein EI555_016332, partial [Monodon monoceros]